MPRSTRTAQLQIRVTPREKARLRQLARSAGQDLSAYVLRRALPPESTRLDELVDELRQEDERRFALAELNNALASLSAHDFADAVDGLDVRHLDPLMQNYVAAMVEQAAAQRKRSAPAWTRNVVPLDEPWFATRLRGLRLHLLRASPVPFKRRNIFIDAGVGARV
jgi:uncharacterized protein (DUF1778 family)